ncbi:MAG: alpha/beta fold hydrolase [Coriobacteriia bacterium]|nr:alpha/beta fold hydrolase [Coriobacteriia bacterium]
MAKWLALSGIGVGSVGIFFGFYYLFGGQPEMGIAIVAATTVGVVGVLAWIRHVFFHAEDAKRLGWESDRPDWAWEVGYANLGFAFMAILAVALRMGPVAQGLTIAGYALYLAQAGLLHGYRYFTDEVKVPARLWRSCVATLLFAGVMGYFAFAAVNLPNGKVVDVEPTSAKPSAAQPAGVMHVKVGDMSVGYKTVGPTSADPATKAALPLVLIMGSSGTMDTWSPELISLLARDRKVIVFDNRGMGETDNPMGAYPFSQLADDTAGLIQAVAGGKADVLGWSMGGKAALDLAVRHPEVVGKLISYAGDAGGTKSLPPTAAAIKVLMDTSADPRTRGMELLALLFPESYRTAHPDYMRTYPIPKEQMLPQEIDLQNTAITDWAGVWDKLGTITSPTLIVTGLEDQFSPAKNADMLVAAIPGAELAAFNGAGHGLMYQDPVALGDAVASFLNK